MTPNLPTLEKRIEHLLTQVGKPGKCRGCGADLYWVRHLNGKLAPYTPDGLNHFINCPQAAMFRGDGKGV